MLVNIASLPACALKANSPVLVETPERVAKALLEYYKVAATSRGAKITHLAFGKLTPPAPSAVAVLHGSKPVNIEGKLSLAQIALVLPRFAGLRNGRRLKTPSPTRDRRRERKRDTAACDDGFIRGRPR